MRPLPMGSTSPRAGNSLLSLSVVDPYISVSFSVPYPEPLIHKPTTEYNEEEGEQLVGS